MVFLVISQSPPNWSRASALSKSPQGFWFLSGCQMTTLMGRGAYLSGTRGSLWSTVWSRTLDLPLCPFRHATTVPCTAGGLTAVSRATVRVGQGPRAGQHPCDRPMTLCSPPSPCEFCPPAAPFGPVLGFPEPGCRGCLVGSGVENHKNRFNQILLLSQNR